MQTHDLIQGSPEWLAYRAQHFNASDAAAMLGVSPHKTRSQLLHEVFTGIPREPSDYAEQHVLAPGHRFEALARPLGEGIIGEDLYPLTGSEGRLSASFDGLTLGEDVPWEHKRLNDELRACMRDGIGGDELPLHHRIQMEQQLLVSGAKRVLFTASEWQGERLIEARHCWYISDSALRASIVDGWAQFEKDLAAYVPPEPQPAAPVGHAPETLPALRIEITGSVTASNLDAFKVTALKRIRSINREITTDQHFADAAEAVKWCETVETRIEAAKEHALSQTESIDALLKTLDEIRQEARTVRLALEKDVTKRKEEIKAEIITKARDAWLLHVAAIDKELAPLRLVLLKVPDFVTATKNLRTVATRQDAADTELANCKIAADATARDWREKLAWYREEAVDHAFLFADLQALIQKPADDFRLAVTARIDAHKAAEAKKKADADTAAQLTAQTIATAAAPKPGLVGIAQVLPLDPPPQVTITSSSGPGLVITAHDGGCGTIQRTAPPWEATEPNLVTLLDDLLGHIDKAFDSKFPSHPKPSPEWWAELLKQSTALREATAD